MEALKQHPAAPAVGHLSRWLPARRQARLKAILATLTILAVTVGLAGCGGGGGGGDDAGSTTNPASGGDLNPPGGNFGGGQGRILYVDKSIKHNIREFDLATRTERIFAQVDAAVTAEVYGGVSRSQASGRVAALVELRAVNGSIGVFGGTRTQVYDASGRLLRSHDQEYGFKGLTSGAVLSRDGSRVAWGGYFAPAEGARHTRIFVLEVDSGRMTSFNFENVSGLADQSAEPFWLPDGRLMILSDEGIYEVDSAFTSARKTINASLPGAGNPQLAADGRTLWFNQVAGGTRGSQIWTLDLTTLAMRHRYVDTDSYAMTAPTPSPDGRWVAIAYYASTCGGQCSPSVSPWLVTAMGIVGVSNDLVDTTRMTTLMLWAGTTATYFRAEGRMAWY